MEKVEEKLKESIIAAGKELYSLGLAPLSKGWFAGNISARHGSGFIITATGSCLGKLRKEDLAKVIKVNLKNKKIESIGGKKPSMETFMHAMVYEKRPDVNAIVHGHCDEFLEKANAMGWKQTKVFRKEGTIALAKEAAEAIGNENFLIIKQHGFLAVGKNLEECMKSIKEKILARGYSGKQRRKL